MWISLKRTGTKISTKKAASVARGDRDILRPQAISYHLGKDCHKAMEILVIQNVFARRYANYLLNGIHLCENLEELHEYPKGGLGKDRLES